MNFKFGKQETIIASIMMVMILSLAFWFFIYRPQSQRVHDLKAEQAKERQAIQSNILTLERLKESREEASQNEMKLVNLLVKMPQNPEIPSLLVQLENLARKTGVKLQTFKPSAPVSNGQFQMIPIDLAISSHFNGISTDGGSLIEFFYRLEKFPRLVSVKSIQVAGNSGTSSLNVSIKLNAFSLLGMTTATASSGK